MKDYCDMMGIDISLMNALSDSLSLRKVQFSDFKSLISAEDIDELEKIKQWKQVNDKNWLNNNKKISQ